MSRLPEIAEQLNCKLVGFNLLVPLEPDLPEWAGLYVQVSGTDESCYRVTPKFHHSFHAFKALPIMVGRCHSISQIVETIQTKLYTTYLKEIRAYEAKRV